MSNKYQNSKIYKIVSPSHPELVYYGSTTQLLCKRMALHRQNFKLNKSSSSKQILQYEDAIILLVENYVCNNRDELNKKEGEYILNNDCINKNIAGRTQKEYRIENKEKVIQLTKQWQEENKEYLKEYKKQWFLNNKKK